MPLKDPIRGRDGAIMHEILVPRGTMVLNQYWLCNTSKHIWGNDALEWNPERWLAPLPQEVLEARIPGVYSNMYVLHTVLCNEIVYRHWARMTFGSGSRSCIGFRFSQLMLSEWLYNDVYTLCNPA